jgi:2-deoxy-D-gluconate 3-dehydrogenase
VTGLFSLSGRTAVVTGAGSGIGRGIALALAAAGAAVVLVGRSDSVEETRALVAEAGGEATARRVDLRDAEALVDAATAVAAARPIDILVNCAGVIDRGAFVETSDERWHDVLAVNLDAPRLLSRVFGAAMVERGAGKIVNIASLLSFQGGREVAGYTVSKHALVGLTRALAN